MGKFTFTNPFKSAPDVPVPPIPPPKTLQRQDQIAKNSPEAAAAVKKADGPDVPNVPNGNWLSNNKFSAVVGGLSVIGTVAAILVGVLVKPPWIKDGEAGGGGPGGSPDWFKSPENQAIAGGGCMSICSICCCFCIVCIIMLMMSGGSKSSTPNF